jgi:hypothetical protein
VSGTYLLNRRRARPAAMAAVARMVNGARGLMGLPEPPPVRGRPETAGAEAVPAARVVLWVLLCASRGAFGVP